MSPNRHLSCGWRRDKATSGSGGAQILSSCFFSSLSPSFFIHLLHISSIGYQGYPLWCSGSSYWLSQRSHGSFYLDIQSWVRAEDLGKSGLTISSASISPNQLHYYHSTFQYFCRASSLISHLSRIVHSERLPYFQRLTQSLFSSLGSSSLGKSPSLSHSPDSILRLSFLRKRLLNNQQWSRLWLTSSRQESILDTRK